jgi:hypothetical protein
MMRVTPFRRTILQCSQRVFTEGLTFIAPLLLAYLNRYVMRPRVRS